MLSTLLRDAVTQLLELSHDAVLPFVQASCLTEGHWQIVLDALLERAEDASVQPVYSAVLTHVAGALSPSAFLRLLPNSGSLAFFLPFLEMSLKYAEAGTLRSAVVQLAVEPRRT
eukprot:TRINITY_DN5158_c0_g1_i2.p1 TRINITY_DN5158_c0_g1~~TRINITY_DN5158_c0_g1_i2.p1  ORF type:complete len:115 (-),score=26.00 TRINITY_DN5158_c0_g1_i2:18-362(-)